MVCGWPYLLAGLRTTQDNRNHYTCMPRPNKIWGKGISQTKSGHLIYKSPKELRDKYVHRVTVEKLFLDTPYSLLLLIPLPYEVHHMDYCKTNNRPDNLLLLDIKLHSAMTSHARPRNGKGIFTPKWGKPSDWLPLFDGEGENLMGDEVPF